MYKTDDPKSDKKIYKPDDVVGQLKLSIAINLIPKVRPVPCKDYRIIVLDPPWDFHLQRFASKPATIRALHSGQYAIDSTPARNKHISASNRHSFML